MHSLSREFLGQLSYRNEDLNAIHALGEHRGKQQLFERQTPQILESLRSVACIESTESSNRIEGIVAPAAQVRRLVLHQVQPRDRTEQEIAGYRDALALVHDSAAAMPITADVLLQLHGMLYRYQPVPGGTWKSLDNAIVEHTGGASRVRFTPVPAVGTPDAMAQLMARYRDAVGQHLVDPLVHVPLLVLDLLCIHPFRDGNGRIGRLLTLLALYHSGYTVGRFISLERLVEESKESYYETLGASSQRWHEAAHDPFPWLRYFWGVLLRAYREFEERAGTLDSGRGAKTRRVRECILRQAVPVSVSEIERLCPGVGRDQIRNVLRALRDEQLIRSTGIGRSAKWVRIHV